MQLPPGAASAGMIWGGGFFLLLLLAQLLVWRVLRPKREIPWLFALYFAAPLALLAHSPASAVFALSLGLAFLMAFPAVQAESPTLWLVSALWEAGGRLDKGALEKATGGHEKIVAARSRDLQAEGLTGPGGELGRTGRLLAKFFRLYRRLFGLKGTG